VAKRIFKGAPATGSLALPALAEAADFFSSGAHALKVAANKVKVKTEEKRVIMAYFQKEIRKKAARFRRQLR
jgi:hypothetical protein